PGIVGNAIGPEWKSPLLVWNDRGAPLVDQVQTVHRLSRLERAAIVSVSAAHIVGAPRRRRLDGGRVLIDSHTQSGIVGVGRGPGHPIVGQGDGGASAAKESS